MPGEIRGTPDYSGMWAQRTRDNQSANLNLQMQQQGLSAARQAQAEAQKSAQFSRRMQLRQLDMQEKAQQQSAQLAQQFLGAWQSALGNTEGMFNKSIEQIDLAMGGLDTAEGHVGKLDTLADDMAAEWQTYKEKYAPLEQAAIDSTMADLASRRKMGSTLESASVADVEGAASRAKADVAASSEAGRRAEADRLAALGIDPTSGRTRSYMNTSRMDEAIGKVLAGTQARTGERDRATGAAALGLQTLNPADSARIAESVQSGSREMMNLQGGLASTAATARQKLGSARAGLAGASANMAGQYAESVAMPQGELGAAMLGLSMGGGR